MLDLSLLIFIQIVSESFPVSSSGHIALALCVFTSYWDLQAPNVVSSFSSTTYLFFLHIPTIIVVTLFFCRTWYPLLLDIVKRRKIILRLIMYVGAADAITCIWYLFFLRYKIIISLYIAFSITALLLFSLHWCRKDNNIITIWHMLLLGFVQGIALLPGISRFGVVYVTARWIGVRDTKAFAISWMLQWPLIMGGICLYSMHIVPLLLSMQLAELGVVLVSSLCSLMGLYLMYLCAKKKRMWLMGFYMFIPILVTFIMGC